MKELIEPEKEPLIEWAAIITVFVIIGTYVLGYVVVSLLFDGVMVAFYGALMVVAVLMALSMLFVMTAMIVYNVYHILASLISRVVRRPSVFRGQN
ncbi:MAG: hypothetical protein ACFFCQ_18795 [Promethearchaeota archaeon]